MLNFFLKSVSANKTNTFPIFLTKICCFNCRHLLRKHPDLHKKYLDEGTKDANTSQPTMTAMFANQSDAYGPKHPMHAKFARSLVENLIVACGLPFSIVEKPEFKAFIHDLNSKFVVPSRQFLTYKILPQVVEKKVAAVHALLDAAQSVALTLDIWTDRASHAFLAITAHTFMQCTAETCLVTFSAFGGSHTGVRIAEEIDKSIKENHLEGKVAYIVTDNASNMRRAFDVLAELQDTNQLSVTEGGDEGVLDDESLWQDMEAEDQSDVRYAIDKQCCSRLPCFAHSLQLVVHDGLSKLNAAPMRLITGKCSKLCNLVHQSALFKEAFEAKFGSGRSLPKANDTRWNSTFFHLQAIANLAPDKLASLLREQNQPQLLLSAKELAMLLELLDILQPFAEATDLTQGDSYPTVGCIVPTVISLDSYLVSMTAKSTHHGTVVRALHKALRRRFRGLFQRLRIVPLGDDEPLDGSFGSMLYPVASLLDPSYGLVWLEEDHPGSPDTKQALKEMIIGIFLDMLLGSS